MASIPSTQVQFLNNQTNQNPPEKKNIGFSKNLLFKIRFVFSKVLLFITAPFRWIFGSKNPQKKTITPIESKIKQERTPPPISTPTPLPPSSPIPVQSRVEQACSAPNTNTSSEIQDSLQQIASPQTEQPLVSQVQTETSSSISKIIKKVDWELLNAKIAWEPLNVKKGDLDQNREQYNTVFSIVKNHKKEIFIALACAAVAVIAYSYFSQNINPSIAIAKENITTLTNSTQCDTSALEEALRVSQSSYQKCNATLQETLTICQKSASNIEALQNATEKAVSLCNSTLSDMVADQKECHSLLNTSLMDFDKNCSMKCEEKCNVILHKAVNQTLESCNSVLQTALEKINYYKNKTSYHLFPVGFLVGLVVKIPCLPWKNRTQNSE